MSDGYTETSTAKPGKGHISDKDLIEKARACLKHSQDVEANQRQREKEDLEFQVGENQWEPEAIKERKPGNGLPPRPMLSISLLNQPMQLVQNQATAAKLGVNVHPVNERAGQKTAEMLQGMYRRIERDSNADQARLWGLDRAKKCGRGWYWVTRDWDEDGEDPWDQEIRIERIFDGARVRMDPSAEKPDFSDAEWGALLVWIELEAFKEQFGDTGVAEDFDDLAEDVPDWAAENAGKKSVLVVDYFWKEHDRQSITHPDGKQKRYQDKVTVHSAKLAGNEVLERTTWGKYIPLIPVVGVELQPFDSERRWEGMVRPARSAQELYNVTLSNAAEDLGRLSKTPYMVAAGQLVGFEEMWKQANVRNFPYLEYNTTDDRGKDVGPPQPVQLDGTKMNLSLLLAQTAREGVQAATAIFDPTLGKESHREKSGRAIQASQQQADASTSNYLQNLANISLPYEARVVLDLIPIVYDAAGRVTTVLGEENDVSTVMLNAPYVMGQDGKPRMLGPEEKAEGTLHHDLLNGKYTVAIQIGRAYQTRLQEGSEEVGAVMESHPELVPIIGPTYFQYRDFPGAQEIGEVLKKMRDQKYPFLAAKEGTQPSPEEAAAKAQAMEMRVQQMGQQLQQAAEMIKTEKVKHEAQVQMAQIKGQADLAKVRSDENIARMNNATKIAVARITAAKASLDAQREDEEEAIALAQEQAHETTENALDRQHEAQQAQMQAQMAARQQAMQGAQDQQMQESDQGHEADMAASGQAHEADMAAQQQASDQAAQAQPDGAGV